MSAISKSTNRGVEQSAANAVKRPDIDEQRQAVDQRDEDDGFAAHSTPGGCRCRPADGHEVSGIAEVEEQKGADKLAAGSDQICLHGRQLWLGPPPMSTAVGFGVDFGW